MNIDVLGKTVDLIACERKTCRPLLIETKIGVVFCLAVHATSVPSAI